MIDYSWVPWFGELAAKIAQRGEGYLIKRAKEVEWGGDDPALRKYGDEGIDPMSFFYFLASKITANQYRPVFGSVQKIFDVKPFPEVLPGIPSQRQNALFHGGKSFYPEVLWRLFRSAAKDEPDIQNADFRKTLNIRGVAITKLTQTLFIVNPKYFIPFDKTNEALPNMKGSGDVENYEDYEQRMKIIKNWFPGCYPYEINSILDVQAGNNPLISKEPDFFQVSTNVYADDTDLWKWNNDSSEDAKRSTFKENNCVYTSEPGGHGMKFPLDEPNRGDIILVRFGRQGRAIGVVKNNDYDPGGWNKNGKIHVYWINKKTTEIEGGLPRFGFSRAKEATQTAFRDTDAYGVTFDLIDRWTGDDSVESPSDEPETPTEEADMSFPLNTILFGPPGTGKTWEAVSWAVGIVDDEDPEELVQAEDRVTVKARYDDLRREEQVDLVTFHQSYAYEDFIEGIAPVLKKKSLRYEIRDGIFKRISSRARKHPNKRFVLVIDEINRGNIARIFGELITLIEPSKRAGGDDEAVVTLPYSREPFSVPGNLYLVGTMNTADRGIALLDSALRRRFDFVERMPNVRLVKDDIEGVNGRAMLRAMNDRITVYLDREHQIGHTYLIGVETIDGLAEAFQRRIVPLLQEYFHDDWAKIRLVLNGNPFIRERGIDTLIPDDRPNRPVFELLQQNDLQWRQAESYRRIYTGEPAEDQD